MPPENMAAFCDGNVPWTPQKDLLKNRVYTLSNRMCCAHVLEYVIVLNLRRSTYINSRSVVEFSPHILLCLHCSGEYMCIHVGSLPNWPQPDSPQRRCTETVNSAKWAFICKDILRLHHKDPMINRPAYICDYFGNVCFCVIPKQHFV